MRIIEKKIISTFKGMGAHAEALNLSVRDYITSTGSRKIYALWGHKIFTMSLDSKACYFCFHGYVTNTTKSRISELLHAFAKSYVFQKNFELFHAFSSTPKESFKIDSTKWYKVENDSIVESNFHEAFNL